MVYSGKPSAACVICKQKKIKCDEVRPTCGQCIKYGRTCSWTYSDRNELLFQNENVKTARKVKARARERVNSPASSDSSSSDSGMAIIDNPAQDVETAALAFYLEGMIITPASSGREVGHLGLLPKMYLNAGAESALAKVTRSMCLSAFSVVDGANSVISQKAYQAYGESVAALYKASQDEKQRTSNETLMAILLMLVNESLLAGDKAPSTQWEMHVRGAMMLLMMKGPAVFKDPSTRRMFNVVRRHLMSSDDGYRPMIPPFFAKPADEALYVNTESELGRLMTRLVDLRPAVMNTLSLGLDTTELRKRCRNLDQQLLDWAADLGPDYQYQLIDVGQHWYPDGHNLRLCNGYRCTRIWAAVLEYRCLLVEQDSMSDHSSLSADITRCTTIMQQMADEIAASLPPEFRPKSERSQKDPKSLVISNASPSFVQHAITAWYLIWPLFVARGIRTLSETQRAWFRSRLVALADNFRFSHALRLARITDRNPDEPLFTESWTSDRIENVWEMVLLYGTGGI